MQHGFGFRCGVVGTSMLAALAGSVLVDETFAPGSGPDGAVSRIEVAPDDRILIAGEFRHYNGVPRPGLARLQPDGSLDNGFDPGGSLPGPVEDLALLPNHQVLAGWALRIPGQTNLGGLVRFRSDGTKDPDFNPPLEWRPDVRLIRGGAWAPARIRLARTGEGGCVLDARPFRVAGREPDTVVRLRADGTLDEDFRPELSLREWDVRRVAVGRDGSVWIAGGLGEPGSTLQGGFGLVRLRADGSRDRGLPAAHVPPWVRDIALLPDGRVVGFDGRRTVFRLNPDGSPDASFTAPTVEGDPMAMAYDGLGRLAVDAAGRVLLADNLTAVNGIRRYGVALLEPSGRLRMDFDLTHAAACSTWNCYRAAAMDSQGRVLLGGTFTTIDGEPRAHLARLRSSPPPYVPSKVYWGAASYGARESDGVVMLRCARGAGWGGRVAVRYATAPGTALDGSDYAGQSGLLFFDADGTATLPLQVLDDDVEEGWETFRVMLDLDSAESGGPAETTVWIQDDDFRYHVMTSGSEASENRPYARLPVTVWSAAKAYGGEDLVPPESLVEVEIEELGAQLGRDYLPLVRPLFQDVDRGDGLAPYTVWAEFRLPLLDNPTWEARRQLRIRFHSRSPRVTFSPESVLVTLVDNDTAAGAGRAIHGVPAWIAPSADGRWLVTGDFDVVDGRPRPGVARLEPDTAVDDTFEPVAGPDGAVQVLMELPGGEVFVAGQFSRVGEHPRSSAARYLPDGRLDGTFLPPTAWDVAGLPPAYTHGAQLADGRLVLAGVGGFQELAWIPGVVRLLPDGRPDPEFQTVDLGLSEITALAVWPDRRVLIGGRRLLTGQTVLLRLAEDGRLDEGFLLTADGAVQALLCPDDGRAWVGTEAGLVLLPAALDAPPGTPLPTAGRLLDPAFTFAVVPHVEGLVLVGRSVIGGREFRRLDARGNPDPRFRFRAVSHVGGPLPVAVHPDGTMALLTRKGGTRWALTRYSSGGDAVFDFRIDRLVRLPTGEVHLSTRGQPVGVLFQRSTRLRRDWVSIYSPAFPQSPPYNLVDTNAISLPQAFYRLGW